MKKTVKYTIIMLAILAVLGAAAFLLLQAPPATQGDDTSSLPAASSTPSQSLLDRDIGQVKAIEVENSQGSFTLVPVSGGAAGEDFTLEGYQERDISNSQISATAHTLLSLLYSKDLGQREDLDAFGLGSDAPQVSIRYTDGQTDTLFMGDTAPESVGHYVRKDGKVYIVSSVPQQVYGSKFDYFNTSIYTVPDRVEVTEDENGSSSETTALDILYSLRLSGENFPEPVEVTYTSSTISGYLMTSPVTVETGNAAFEELMTSLKTLTAGKVVEAGITEALLEEYGLQEPEAAVEFDMNDSKHSLAVSKKDADGNRYLIADDTDLIYQVSNSLVEKWAETSITTLRMSYIWIPNIKNVEKLTLTLDGDQVHQYHITRTKDEEKSTEDNIQYILDITDAGGQTVDYEEAYQPFYQKLISLAVFMQDRVDYSGTPAIKVEYEYFGGGKDQVEFYKMQDQNRYAAVLNGGFNGQVRGSEVSALLELVP